MRRIVLTLALSLVLTGGAAAQAFTGNWACMAGDKQAGLLTIYGNSYGFASTTFGDKSSGTGAIQGYSDGVTFADGPLVANLGLQVGRLLAGEGAVSMTLESSSAILMVCTSLNGGG
ncbi:MAG TPA: hypothetical protein VGM83_20315 [Devosiaceae bacterium]|jgi:hypothetical protein